MIWLLFFLLFSLPKNILKLIVQSDREHTRAFWQGLVWNITHLSNGEKLKLFIHKHISIKPS